MPFIPGSNIRLFTLKYLFTFEDGDPFSASLHVKQVHLIVLYIILFLYFIQCVKQSLRHFKVSYPLNWVFISLLINIYKAMMLQFI